MENDSEFDEEQAAYDNLVRNMKTLNDYFSDPQRDMSKLKAMLRLYDGYFEKMIKNFLKGSLGQRDYSDVLETYKSVGKKIPAVLSSTQNGKEIGNLLVQEVISGKTEILGRRPSLLQYVFNKFCKKYDIPFQPLYYSYGVGAGMAMEEDDSIAIGGKIYMNHSDNTSKNAYAIYVLAHELQHIRQRHSNPHGSEEEKLLKLYSQVQKLEDGYYKGVPSHHIAKHEEFPDEVRADYDACPFVSKYISSELSLPEETLKAMTEFLKHQQVKLVSQCVQTEKPLSPEEYLEYFVDTKLSNNANLSPTEKERTEKFVQAYEEIAQRGMQP